MAQDITAENCPAKCLERPDAVEKVNWKCVECRTDLEQAFKDLMAAREAAYQAKLALEAKQAAVDELSEEEKEKRRRLA